jgi:hypothetical protein
MTIEDDGAFCPDCGARLDRRRAPPPPAHPSFDDNTKQIVVGRDRRHVPFARWKMLCVLRRCAPNLARTSMLVACLHEDDYPETVRVQICLLREDLAGTPLVIQTAWGLGYHLMDYRHCWRRDERHYLALRRDHEARRRRRALKDTAPGGSR